MVKNISLLKEMHKMIFVLSICSDIMAYKLFVLRIATSLTTLKEL